MMANTFKACVSIGTDGVSGVLGFRRSAREKEDTLAMASKRVASGYPRLRKWPFISRQCL